LHQRLTGPEIYLNKGRQDLTADVNFTDLEAWGEALGWEDSHVVTQSAFLHEQLPGLKKSLTAASPDAFIADPEGAGKAFKVWTVRRGAA
jgi:SAM-dependent MidA family methyltransferase